MLIILMGDFGKMILVAFVLIVVMAIIMIIRSFKKWWNE